MPPLPQQLAFAFDQRWDQRRPVWRAPEGERLRPDEYGVEAIRKREAKPFVLSHHYSGAYPAAHCAVGLFRRQGVAPARLVGVAVFSEGIRSTAALPKWTSFSAREGTELGRLVLLPEVPYNGESWFICRAFEVLRQERPLLRAVLSYSDPTERRAADGSVVKPGHVGTIYQASNALYLGRATARNLPLLPDGRVLQPYNFNKYLNRREGWASAERAIAEAGQLAGCNPRSTEESDTAWVERVKASLGTLPHPGNLAYAFGLDGAAWRRIREHNGPPKEYPKLVHFARPAKGR